MKILNQKSGTVTVAALLALLLTSAPAGAAWFDNLHPAPRAGALAGALTAAADDASAVYYNPAMLSFAPIDYEAGVSYRTVWGQDFISYMEGRCLFTVPQMGSFGRFGLAVQSLSTEYGGNTLADETAITFSQGCLLMKDIHSSLAFGYSINLYGASFGETVTGQDLGSAWTVGFDAGFVAEVRTRTRIGAFLKNLNKPTLGEEFGYPLPRALSLGVSYLPYAGIRTNIDVEKPVDSDAIIKGGVEYEIASFAVLRAGLVNDPASFNAGLAIRYAGLEVEYAYADHPVLPGSHYIGIGYAR